MVLLPGNYNVFKFHLDIWVYKVLCFFRTNSVLTKISLRRIYQSFQESWPLRGLPTTLEERGKETLLCTALSSQRNSVTATHIEKIKKSFFSSNYVTMSLDGQQPIVSRGARGTSCQFKFLVGAICNRQSWTQTKDTPYSVVVEVQR